MTVSATLRSRSIALIHTETKNDVCSDYAKEFGLYLTLKHTVHANKKKLEKPVMALIHA